MTLQVLGMPSEDSWPGVSKLPNYKPGLFQNVSAAATKQISFIQSLFDRLIIDIISLTNDFVIRVRSLLLCIRLFFIYIILISVYYVCQFSSCHHQQQTAEEILLPQQC